MIQSGIVFLLSLLVLKGLFSIDTKKDNHLKSTELLAVKFKRKDIILIILFPLILIIMTIALSCFFNFLSEISINKQDFIYIIKPGNGTWLGMGLISTLGYSILMIFLIVKLLFKIDEAEYWTYYNRKYGLNAASILKFLGVISILIGFVWTSLNFNSYIKFRTNEIEINKFLSIEKVIYSNYDISKIISYNKSIAPNGKLIDRPHYAIVFSDHSIWRTDDEFRVPQKSDNEIVKFLLIETGLSIEKIEIDQKNNN